MTYTELTPQMTKDFWDYMSDLYGTKILSKKDSSFMKVVGSFLSLMKIQDKEKFMSKYTTTIGKTIYVSFDIGGTTDKNVLASQISTCVHEHQHVVQYNRGGFDFTLEYVFQHDQRAKLEAEAYSTNIEIYHWYTGKLLDTKVLATKLLDYGCDANDVLVAEKIMNANVKIIKYGGIIHEASKEAIAWLNKNAGTLKKG
jgi:hypothetical protein